MEGACLPHLDSPPGSYLQVGLHVTCAIQKLLSVFIRFYSSRIKVSLTSKSNLITRANVPGGFAERQGALLEPGLGGGEESGLSTPIRMVYCLLHSIDSQKHLEAPCSMMKLSQKVYELGKQHTFLIGVEIELGEVETGCIICPVA